MPKVRNSSSGLSADQSAAISDAIGICQSGQLGFESASKAVLEDASLRSELMQYSIQRQEFVIDLRSALAQLGDAATPDQTRSESPVHPAWLRVRHLGPSSGKYAVLVECERAEDAAVEIFRNAHAAELPPPLGGLIYTQYQAVIRVHGRIRSLRDAARSGS